MKIAFIHSDKKIRTGAHYINELISSKLREKGISVRNFYPKTTLIDSPSNLKGLANILFFYGLLEHRKDIAQYSIVQGTTYTPLPFLTFSVPVVCHFGSTTQGFLDATPAASNLEHATKKIWYRLRKEGILSELNIRTKRPLRDIAEIEQYVASRATAVIAASARVRDELVAQRVNPDKISVIHNAIEDYWFENHAPVVAAQLPRIVFLGRIGSDAFTLKLKGVDRLIHLFLKFPEIEKTAICITMHKKLKDWLRTNIQKYTSFINFRKDLIPGVLRPLKGSILFIPSRYEGFSLSLIEGMSQGLIPISYPVGIAPEIIVNGHNGFLVKNQEEAIQRVHELLKDGPLREKMSLLASETTLQFQSSNLVERLQKFYYSIIGATHKTHTSQSNGISEVR